MVRRLVFAGVLWIVISAYGEGERFPILHVGGNVFSNVTVTAVSATDIYFSHQGGLGNAKLKLLEPAVQKQFHYNSAKALATQAAQAQANALYAQEVRLAPPVHPKSAVTAAANERREPEPLPANTPAANSFLNQHAPELIAEKWVGDAPQTSGKFMLVTFWATWCGPCRSAIPIMNQLQGKYREQLVVIGVSDESESDIRNMAEPRMEFSIASDPRHRSATALGVRGLPHAILVDPRGIVRFEGHPGLLEGANLEPLFAFFGG